MSGEKAVAINRAWEQWPNIDAEAVAGMVAAGWDARAAQVVPQPDREAIVKAIGGVAEHDPDTHDFISPEKAADAVLAALSTQPAAGEVEWEYAVRDRKGIIYFSARAGEIEGDVAIRRRKAGPWIEVQS